MTTNSSLLDPPHLNGEGITTGPTSARTSRTRVDNGATTGSILEQGRDSIMCEEENGDNAEVVEAEVPPEAQTSITFLLITGKRRTMLFQPETVVGRVKELIWNSWPSEWQDERPPAPSYLRLLYLGRMLQDDESLAKLHFPTHIPSTGESPPTPPPSTIVHLSIRPYAPNGDEDLHKKKGRRRRGRSEGEESAAVEEGVDTGCCGSCLIC